MVLTSRMETRGDVIIHQNEDPCTYVLAILPGKWILAAAHPDVLGDNVPDKCTPRLRDMFDAELAELYKATDAAVFLEYKAIQHAASRHGVPPENIRITIHENPEGLLDLLSSHTMPEEIPLLETDIHAVMTKEVWKHADVDAFRDWFNMEYTEYVDIIHSVIEESAQADNAPPGPAEK